MTGEALLERIADGRTHVIWAYVAQGFGPRHCPVQPSPCASATRSSGALWNQTTANAESFRERPPSPRGFPGARHP